MQLLSPKMLMDVLTKEFPPNASCWSQAGDEVRDMCRAVRQLAKVPDSEAVDFKACATPAQWNIQGVAGTVKFYQMLDAEKQKHFCDRLEDWLASEA